MLESKKNLSKTICCYSLIQLCLILCDSMGCSMPSFPGVHCLPEFAQTHVHWVNDAMQPSHSLNPCQRLLQSGKKKKTNTKPGFPIGWKMGQFEHNKNNDCDGLKQIKHIKIHKFRMLLLKTGKLWSFLQHQLIILAVCKECKKSRDVCILIIHSRQKVEATQTE